MLRNEKIIELEAFEIGKDSGIVPRWARMIYYDPTNDELYWSQCAVPFARLLEVANDVKGRAVQDEQGHIYLSASWSIELSDKPGMLRELEAKLREAIEIERKIPQTCYGWPVH